MAILEIDNLFSQNTPKDEKTRKAVITHKKIIKKKKPNPLLKIKEPLL